MIDQAIPAQNISLPESINIFGDYLENIRRLKKPIIGYALSKNDIKQLTREFKKNFNFFNLENPEKHIDTLLAIHDLFEFINSKHTDNREFFDDVLNLLSNYENSILKEQFEVFYAGLDSINNQIIMQNLPKNFRLKHLNNYVELLRLAIITETNTKLVNSLQSEGVQIETQNLSGNTNGDVSLDYITELYKTGEELLSKRHNLEFIEEFIELHPELAENLNVDLSNNINEFDFLVIEKSEDLLGEVIEYKKIEQKLNKIFTDTPPDEYVNNIKTVEQLITAQMTHFLDKRIINYSQDNAGEVNTLKMVLKNKQQFPIDLFENLKKAFPCILAGIRDYAEYIPLEKNLFDLIIIDEASQVSISQALPALIRGKQIIVLGDDKQFSNVKAGNASKVTNQQYKSRIREVFRKEKINGSDTKGWETKVKENFDIKNSILKFSRFIRNYQCQLQKHFRCYPEIISYSDKYFYDNTLQCMKIRGIPIDDVIKIDVIEHDGKLDKAKNTNELEAKHIIQNIKKLREDGFNKTLGIITPHREQVTLLFDMLNNLEDKDWIFDTCKMKIMTFDTCQGEERDYIFYSMVATKEKDMLNWIFPVQFDGNKDNVKAQRLNVGFSRAKECIHFVLSKPIENFKGEIRNALVHYRNELELSKEKIVGETDPNSPMESKVQDIFYATKFYKDNKENIEFIPQFDLGRYLKQLDRNYNHPDYKVDFLLIYKDKKIVIEYDGFKEHFTNLDEVNISNYKYYMNADDIYRQKVLEGYGYRFLRINRFNIGNDPVSTLNERIENIVKKN
jgi:very-short-patch-repair endonuclease